MLITVSRLGLRCPRTPGNVPVIDLPSLDLAIYVTEIMSLVGFGALETEESSLSAPALISAIQEVWPGNALPDILDYFSHQNTLLAETNLPIIANVGWLQR